MENVISEEKSKDIVSRSPKGQDEASLGVVDLKEHAKPDLLVQIFKEQVLL